MASKDELAGRFLNFAVAIIDLGKLLLNSYWGRHINGQLFRAGTSAGSNYEEACAAESRADFIHKLQIVLKELRESKYWLKLIKAGKL
ncbi:MAG: four helix bundle protein, partial [Bacteroidales bacterium]|nr:four helix bundle protein [Bacteroidales bacterium]